MSAIAFYQEAENYYLYWAEKLTYSQNTLTFTNELGKEFTAICNDAQYARIEPGQPVIIMLKMMPKTADHPFIINMYNEDISKAQWKSLKIQLSKLLAD